MKKVLFSTTALAAAGALAFGASDALAQKKLKPVEIKVGGYFNSTIGYAEQSGSFESTGDSTARVGYDQFNIVNDSEIYFRGNTKLPSGLGVSVTVQLETDQTAAGIIDESYSTISGGFGQIMLGSTKGASVKMFVGAPSTGTYALGNTDHDNFIIKPANVGPNANFSSGTSGMGASDAVKVVYLSPTLKAVPVSIGASFAPSGDANDNMPEIGGNSGDASQMYDAVIRYVGNVGGAAVRANVAYGETNGTANNSLHWWRSGASIRAGGVNVGFGYYHADDKDSGKGGTANSDEQTSYNIGAQYTAGGYTVGVGYGHTEMPFATGTQGEDEMDKYTIGVNKPMGQGITLTGQLAYVDWSDELTSDANNNSGWALLGGIRVAF